MTTTKLIRWAMPALLIALLIASSDVGTAKLCVMDPVSGGTLVCSPF